jgi:NTE family protein
MIASSASSLFSPVEIDGRILVDGGVVNNHPIEEV